MYDLGYVFAFSPLRQQKSVKLLEVGFGAGAGSKSFIKYFENAHVHTLDFSDQVWNRVKGSFQGQSLQPPQKLTA